MKNILLVMLILTGSVMADVSISSKYKLVDLKLSKKVDSNIMMDYCVYADNPKENFSKKECKRQVAREIKYIKKLQLKNFIKHRNSCLVGERMYWDDYSFFSYEEKMKSNFAKITKVQKMKNKYNLKHYGYKFFSKEKIEKCSNIKIYRLADKYSYEFLENINNLYIKSKIAQYQINKTNFYIVPLWLVEWRKDYLFPPIGHRPSYSAPSPLDKIEKSLSNIETLLDN